MNPFAVQLQSDLTFFGLTSDYDQRVMDQIFDLVYHGHFAFEDAYNLPVNIRSYYYAKLVKLKNDEVEAANKKNK